MGASAPHTIVNVGYKSTNFWVISAGTRRLLLDLGWPGTMGQMRAALDRAGVPLREIGHGLATHYHLDHAGLAQELKAAGMRLLVADVQVPWVQHLGDHAKPADRLVPVDPRDNLVFPLQASRALLAGLGLAGEVLHTPGHSPDSVSLLLDDGAVFTGDLTHPLFMTEAEAPITGASWALLRERGARTVYAGHGPVRPMPELW
ncbi:MAG: MBL fold metallo-hydrolase [Gemmatimonadaceae bacterium]|nr:MBL fold metallo-hydrolase [Gemmatimonadaceae bacterium]